MKKNEREGEYREWRNENLKYEREVRHKNFLKECKHFRITPKFLQIRNKYIYKWFRKEVEVFERKILNKVIRKKYGLIEKLRKNGEEKLENLKGKYEQNEIQEMKRKLENIKRREEREHIEKHNKKLRNWLMKKGPEFYRKEKDCEYDYINLTKFKPSKQQEALIRKGPKHILADKICIRDSIPRIEGMLEKIPAKNREEWRVEIGRELEKRRRKNDTDIEDRRALEKLKRNRELTFLKTDKTNKLVIMERDKYNEKMEEAIREIKAVEVKEDTNNKINRKLKDLMREGQWPDGTKPIKEFTATNTPNIFGRLKDHKDPMRMRPIVNKRGGPTYELERYMKIKYKEIIKESEHSLNSTEDFIKKIREVRLEENCKMVSFDVKNLYPSVNTLEMEKIIEEEFKKKYGENSKITETLVRANSLLLRENYFTFNNKCYKQTQGLPMGSPISGVLAETKMREVDRIVNKRNGKKIKLWIRYVDDVFAIIEGEPEEILNNINKIDTDIQFTVEEERNGELNFLDVTLKRTDRGEIRTTVYRKPTTVTEIISKKCETPTNYKLAAIRAYINRAILICSTEELLEEEMEKIIDQAKKAGYRREEIERMRKKREQKLEIIECGQKTKQIYTQAINYDKGIGIKIARKAAKMNIKVPIRPNKSIYKRIRNEQDVINPMETAGVYKLEGKNAEGKEISYIGVTKRKIKERIEEHKKDKQYGRRGTVLAQKNYEENIEIDYQNPKKLSSYINHNYAYRREAIEIIREKSAINSMEHSKINENWKRMIKEEARGEVKRREHAQKEDRGYLEGNREERQYD